MYERSHVIVILKCFNMYFGVEALYMNLVVGYGILMLFIPLRYTMARLV